MVGHTVQEKAPSASSFEVDSQDGHLQSKLRQLRLADSTRSALTLLALLLGISVLGVSADALAVFDATRVPQGYQLMLPLWPENFNLRPTVALVVGAAIVTMTNVVSLVCSRIAAIRNRAVVHTSRSFAAPLIGLIAAVVAVGMFYAVNASDKEDTLLSWTCRWGALSMLERPHFGTLCKESWAGLYMSILLIPIEAAVLAVATWQMKLERYTTEYAHARRSPTPSDSRAAEQSA